MTSTALRYEFAIDTSVANNTHNMTIAAVGRNKRVLDVGCASGYFAAFLAQEQGCDVQGLEPDAVAAAVARERLGADRVTVGGVELLTTAYSPGTFDVVVFADVLEHLVDPSQALRDSRRLLAPGGCIVASIPNCAHGDLRLMLLAGHFTYRSTGLLDSTHLRFLTRHSIPRLFTRSGYRLVDMQSKTIPLGRSEFGVNLDYFRPEVLDTIRDDPHHEDYQYVIRAEPDPLTPTVHFTAGRDWAEQRLVQLWARAFSPAERVCLVLPVDEDDAAVARAVAAVEEQCRAAGTDADHVADIELVQTTVPLELPECATVTGAWTVAQLRDVACPPVDALLG